MTTAPVPMRVTVVLSHPVQYFAPWFRYIASRRPELELTVLYAAMPTAEQQGVGFGRAFAWDIPLTEGYRFEVCGNASGTQFDSDHFFGLDVRDIGARIAATRPDVVLVPGWHSVMQVRALRACRRLGIPVLYRGDSTLSSGPRRLVRPLWRLKTRAMLRQFDGFLAVGVSADEYLRSFDVPDPLIFRSPHCIDNDRFAVSSDAARASGARDQGRAAIGASPDDFVVGFAGKFVDRKQPLAAVRAVAGLGPSASLMTIGDGPLADAVRTEATRLGVRLAWRGFVNQSELPGALALTDCLLVPSAWESWGLVVNEALAAGVPCVATSGVEAARDLIVEGTTGYVVPVGDVDAMTRRLEDVAAARAAGHTFAPACRDAVSRLSFETATDGLVSACRRVVLRRGHALAAARSAAVPRVIAICTDMVSVFGRERMTFEVLRALRERGAAVHCIVNSWKSRDIVRPAEEIGATWSTGSLWTAFARSGWTVAGAARLVADVARASLGLLRDARRTSASHILVSGYTSIFHNLPALVLLRLMGRSIVCRLGNAPETGRFYERLWRWVINPVVTRFVANSRFTAQALAATGVPGKKIRTVYNFAPLRKAHGHRDEQQPGRIIYVGQLIPPKGVDRLLDAVALLRARGHDASLDVVGDVDGWEPAGWEGYRDRLRARAEQPDLRGRVRFLGVREDVPELMAASAVHCCPSLPEIREGFGIVTVEAKEAGIPSVVTSSGALPELVTHQRDGWVCSEATAEALADGLEYFLAHPERLTRAGIQAKASAAGFRRPEFLAAWLECFDMGTGGVDVTRAAGSPVVESHVH